MKNKVFWKNDGYKPFPTLKNNTECDYLIVGGGITGVATAYFLRNSGKKVVLIEKNKIASGATGMAAGILTPSAELDLSMIVKKLGKRGLGYWKLLDDAHNAVIKIIKKERIKCSFELIDAIYAQLHDKTANKVIKEYKAHKGSHLRVRFLEHIKLDKYIHSNLFDDAVLSHNVISLNPLAFTQNLAKVLPKNGVRVFENTALEKLTGRRAITSGGCINFKKIILAMDSQTHLKSIIPIKTTIAVSYPLPKDVRKVNFPKDFTLWDSKDNYDYLKFLPDNRLLVGLGDIHTNPSNKTLLHRPHLNKINRFVKKLFPNIKIKWEYAWSGTYGTTKNYMPFIKIKNDTITIAAPAGQLVSIMLAQQVAKSLPNQSQTLQNLMIV